MKIEAVACLGDTGSQAEGVSTESKKVVYSDSLSFEDNLKDDTLNDLENYLQVISLVDTVHLYNLDSFNPLVLGIILSSCRVKLVTVEIKDNEIQDGYSKIIRRMI